jgi:chitin-binding protein
MTRTLRPHCCMLLLAAALLPGPAHSHGTMTTPVSRIYYCYLNNPENPTDPACRAVKAAGGTSAVYNWNGVNQAAAHGNHQAVVPDGQLCSGGNPTFATMDLLRSDWHATPIAPELDGSFEFIFRGTAPHATRDWTFYVSKPGWTPASPLRWADLDEFCRLGSVPLSGGNYHLRCPLPQATGRRVIYSVWQRSDSGEAFYTCMDVNFGNGSDRLYDDGFEPLNALFHP